MTYEQILHDYASGGMVDYNLLQLHQALSISKKRVSYYENLPRTITDEEASDFDRATGITKDLMMIHHELISTPPTQSYV